MVKGLGQTADHCINDVCSISFNFHWKLANLVQSVDEHVLMFSSYGQRSRSRFLKKVVLLISLDLLVEIWYKIGTVHTSRE